MKTPFFKKGLPLLFLAAPLQAAPALSYSLSRSANRLPKVTIEQQKTMQELAGAKTFAFFSAHSNTNARTAVESAAPAVVAADVLAFLQQNDLLHPTETLATTNSGNLDSQFNKSFSQSCYYSYSYSCDVTAPRISNVTRQTTPSTTSADAVIWRFTFDETVTGVDVTDFLVSGTTATVTDVTLTAGTYYVTVSGGNLASLNGLITISAIGGGIQDLAANQLVNTTPRFTNDNGFVLDNTLPAVSSINVSGSPASSATSMSFSAIFNSSCRNYSIDDFTLTTTGTAVGTIVSVSTTGPSSSTTVSINSISGVGTLRLDLNAFTNIIDGASNGNNNNGYVAAFTSGNTHTVAPATPTVTDARISISGATGTSGGYKVGDTVTATWNNTASGDNNSGITGVTADFSQFGGGAAVVATNSSGTWTATYTIVSGAVDTTNRNVSITATNAGGGTTRADTTNATVDNVMPIATDASISISGASGTGGAYKIGDTVTATWNNTAGGDNNSDTISSTTVNFSAFGGGAAVAASNSSGTWTATYTIVSGVLDASNRNVSVTVTDNVGNTTTTADTTNATVDNQALTLLSLSPLDNAIDVATDANLVITLSENITLNSGNIVIYNAVPTAVATIDVSSHGGQLSISGSALTINPSANLATNTNYSVQIPATAILDAHGNNFAGISDNTSWSFTVPDITPPVVTSIVVSGSPSAAATSISYTVDFSETVNNISTTDFSLTASGTAAATIANVSATSGSSVTVTVNSITGTGSLRLDLAANSDIADASGNGNNTNGYVPAFSSGSSHTLDRDAPVAPTGLDLAAASDSGVSNSDNITNDTTPTITGTAEANSNISVSTDQSGAVVGTTIADGSGAWSLTTSLLAVDLAHSLIATATDAAGNTSTASTALVVQVAATAPSVTSTTPDATAVSAAASVVFNVAFGGAAYGFSTDDFSLTATGTAVGNIASVSATSGTTVAVTINAITGTGTLRLDTIGAGIVDAGGNLLSAFNAGTVHNVDRDAPTITSVAFNQASVTSANESAISVTLAGAETSTTANYSISSNNGGTPVTGSVAIATASQQLTGINVGGLADGTLTMSLTLTDAAGNLSSPAVTATIAKDANVPAISSVAVTNGNFRAGGVITVSATLSEDVNVSGTNSTIAIVMNGITRLAAFTSETAGVLSFSYTVQVNENTDGNGIIVLANSITLNGDTIRDLGNNNVNLSFSQVSNAGAQVDTSAPVNPVVVTPASNVTVNTPDFTISGTHSENNLIINLYADANNNGVADNATVILSATVAAGTWNLVPILLANSVNNYVVVAVDSAGNSSATVNVLSITHDDIAPTAPAALNLAEASDSGISSTDNMTNDTTPTITGTGEANATIRLSSDLNAVVGNGVSDSSGNWSITSSMLSSGAHTLTASAMDAASNVTSASLAVIIDAEVPSLSAIANQTIAQGGTTGTLNFTPADNLTAATGLTITANSSNTTAVPLANVVVGGNGASRTVAVTGVVAGASTVSLTIEDAAGNKAIGTFLVTVNTGPMISGIPDGVIDQDKAYSFVPITADLNGDTLIFGITNKPSWASFNTATGALTGTPVQANVGTTSDIVISVSDGTSSASLPAFAIAVLSTVNSLAPILTVPLDIELDATALHTPVSLRQLLGLSSPTSQEVLTETLKDLATDSTSGNECCSAFPLHLDANNNLLLAPGRNEIVWKATNSQGLSVEATQVVNLRPLVSLSKSQTAIRGSTVAFKVVLNGKSPVYPLSIPYVIDESTTAAINEHSLVNGVANFTAEGQVEVVVPVQLNTSSGDSQLVVRLNNDVNTGVNNLHVIAIREGNIAPTVFLQVNQGGIATSHITASGGLVTVTALVTDLNVGDSHSFDWSATDSALVDTDSNPVDAVRIFNPINLTARHQVQVTVTDSAGASEQIQHYLRVVPSLPILNLDTDTDGDGINDLVEGLGDSSGNGIPDYLDNMTSINVLPQVGLITDAYLVECDPGLRCGLGKFALMGNSGGVQILDAEIGIGNELVSDEAFDPVGGIFDFVIRDLPTPGQTARVVIPQQAAIPANAIYRKFSRNGQWVSFVENASNLVHSAAGSLGYCPPPGSLDWQSGLVVGHMCVQLTLQDGGPNDDDGIVNGAITDPGAVSVATRIEPPPAPVNTKSKGGGAIEEFWLLLISGLMLLARVLPKK